MADSIIDKARRVLSSTATDVPCWPCAAGAGVPCREVPDFRTRLNADGEHPLRKVDADRARRETGADAAPDLAAFVLMVDKVTRKAVTDNAEFDGTEHPEAEYLACALDIRRFLGLPTTEE